MGLFSGPNGALFGPYGALCKMGLRKPGKLLRDYRWVYTHSDARLDKTPGRKALRKLMKENPNQFMAQMGRLEAELTGLNEKVEVATAAAKGEEVGGVDGGTTKALELVDRLLNEWETSKL